MGGGRLLPSFFGGNIMTKLKFNRVIVAVHRADARFYMRHKLIGKRIAWVDRQIWSKNIHPDVGGYEWGHAFLSGKCPYTGDNPDLESYTMHAISTKKI